MIPLDEVDNRILGVLKENGRLPLRRIAKKAGVPLATVNRRMSKLMETGIIKKFTIELDNEKTGRNMIAYVLIRAKHGANQKNILEELGKCEAVEDMAAITGPFDLMLKVRVSDNEELSAFLLKTIQNAESIDHTETMMTLSLKPYLEDKPKAKT